MEPTINNTLAYYDGEQVCLKIEPNFLKLYLCVLTSDGYLCTLVDEPWIRPLMVGKWDLRSTILEAPSKQYTLLKSDDKHYDPKKATPIELTEDMLPGEGYVMEAQNAYDKTFE
jgi:hypothetical protein